MRFIRSFGKAEVVLIVVLVFCLFFLSQQTKETGKTLEKFGWTTKRLGEKLIQVGSDFLSNYIFYTNTNRRLVQQNQQLKQNNQQLNQKIIQLQIQYNQQKNLSPVGLLAKINYIQKLVPILFLNHNLYQYQFIIAAGKKQGLSKGQFVIGFQDGKTALLGQIIHLDNNTATVKLLQDVDSILLGNVRWDGHSILGMIQGGGGFQQDLVMSFYYQNLKIPLHTGVYTSGSQQYYPSGLNIASVEKSNYNRHSQKTILTLKPAIDVSTLEYVSVLIPKVIHNPDNLHDQRKVKKTNSMAPESIKKPTTQ